MAQAIYRVFSAKNAEYTVETMPEVPYNGIVYPPWGGSFLLRETTASSISGLPIVYAPEEAEMLPYFWKSYSNINSAWYEFNRLYKQKPKGSDIPGFAYFNTDEKDKGYSARVLVKYKDPAKTEVVMLEERYHKDVGSNNVFIREELLYESQYGDMSFSGEYAYVKKYPLHDVRFLKYSRRIRKNEIIITPYWEPIESENTRPYNNLYIEKKYNGETNFTKYTGSVDVTKESVQFRVKPMSHKYGNSEQWFYSPIIFVQGGLNASVKVDRVIRPIGDAWVKKDGVLRVISGAVVKKDGILKEL